LRRCQRWYVGTIKTPGVEFKLHENHSLSEVREGSKKEAGHAPGLSLGLGAAGSVVDQAVSFASRLWALRLKLHRTPRHLAKVPGAGRTASHPRRCSPRIRSHKRKGPAASWHSASLCQQISPKTLALEILIHGQPGEDRHRNSSFGQLLHQLARELTKINLSHGDRVEAGYATVRGEQQPRSLTASSSGFASPRWRARHSLAAELENWRSRTVHADARSEAPPGETPPENGPGYFSPA